MYVITLSGESYYIIRQEEFITLSGDFFYIIWQQVFYIIRRCYYIIRQLLHYQALLLHYQAVITLTGDYYIIGCNTLRYSDTGAMFRIKYSVVPNEGMIHLSNNQYNI